MGSEPERAVLVGVDLGVRSSRKRAGVAGARSGQVRLEEHAPGDSASEIQSSSGASQSLAGLDAEESLAEFRELVSSAGGQVAAELLQRRPRPDPATLIGSGKVEEIAAVAASTQADLVLFDHDLSPTQLRNLEAALPCRVLDRTQLILDIFARHARTREGQLQVELAQLEYMLPRLAGKGKSMSQLGGGIGTRGPGETQARDRPATDSATHRSAEAGSGGGAPRAQAAAPAPRVGSGAHGGPGGLHQRRQEHAFQPPDWRRRCCNRRACSPPSIRSFAPSSCPAAARFCSPTRSASSATCRTRWSPASAPRWKRWRRPRCCCMCATPHPPMEKNRKLRSRRFWASWKSLAKPRIEVLNKIDLLDEHERDGLLARSQAGNEVAVSARTGEGMDALLAGR